MSEEVFRKEGEVFLKTELDEWTFNFFLDAGKTKFSQTLQ